MICMKNKKMYIFLNRQEVHSWLRSVVTLPNEY